MSLNGYVASTLQIKQEEPPAKRAKIAHVPALDKGVARLLNTKVVDIVRFLKDSGALYRLDDLAIRSNNEDLLTNTALQKALIGHDRVLYNVKTQLYRYKPDYDIKSKEDLLRVLKAYLPRGGIAIKTLKESWPAAQTALEELEKQGKVYVTRSSDTKTGTEVKEGVMKLAFFNDLDPVEPVDSEFKDLWHSLKTPDETDLPRQLEAEGLKATAQEKLAIDPASQGLTTRKKKKAGNRRIKITNTHLSHIDLTKDYPAPPK